MDIHSAKASEIGDLANFYRITDYGGSVAPADRVVYATEEERIIGAGRISDAEFYGVQTKVLNQAVKRNKDRFPKDFMFRLTKAEKEELVTNCDHLEKLKFSPTTPNVFTEHGAIIIEGAASIFGSIIIMYYYFF